MGKRGLEDGKSAVSPSLEYDAALAELLSLLDPAPFSVDACVNALQRAQGDVSAAAEILLIGGGGESSSSSSQSSFQPSSSQLGPRKRAKQGGLRQWFKPPLGKAPPSLSTPPLDPSSSSDSQTLSPSLASTPSSPPTPVDRQASAANWAALLCRAPTEKPKAAPQRPICLATPAAVAASGLPLAILTSPLTPSFAAQLFHEMMAESSQWGRNKLYIAGKEVQSNHQATSYARHGEEWGEDGASAYYYNGVKYGAKPFTPCLSKAADMVEAAVNEYLDTVPRYPLEYKGRWRANACAANRYDGAQATVGFHSDQMTYLGPYPTIASLSLGTPRAFRLRAVATADAAYAPEEPPRTYEVTLGNNSLVLMTPGCQERYKHTIPPQRALDTFRMGWDADGHPIPPGEQTPFTSRINITFRFYRDDFRPDCRGSYLGTPLCKCGIPTILRADQRAKARSALGIVRGSGAVADGVVDDEMLYFWQCQSPSRTGDMKGCGFFKILDMRGEGRGPCWGDEMTGGDDNEDEGAVKAAEEGVPAAEAVVSDEA